MEDFSQLEQRSDQRYVAQDALPRGSDLLYRQELISFLESFGDGNIAENARKVRAIWREHGFLHPRGLTKRLYLDELKSLDKGSALFTAKQEALEDIINATYHPEDLTRSYDNQQNSGLMTGLAHLYAQSVGKEPIASPLVMVDGDFSNMGGTNAYFRKLLAAEALSRGGNLTDFDEKTGHAEVDTAARIVANMALRELKAAVYRETGGKGHVFAARSGGDEIRLFVNGLSESRVEQLLREKVHPRIERFLAHAGLHDHPHSKKEYKNDPYRTGFGLALAAVDLGMDKSPPELIALLDKRIDVAKTLLGHARKGELPQDYVTVVTDTLPQETRENPLSLSAALGSIREIAISAGALFGVLREQIADRAMQWRVRHGLHAKGDINDTDRLHAAREAFERPEFKKYNIPAPQRTGLHEVPSVYRKPFENPAITVHNRLLELLKSKDVIRDDLSELPKAEQKLFLRALEGFEACDPASGLPMKRDLPEQTAYYAQDMAQLAANAALLANNPDLATGKSRLMLVQCGNTAGINKISHAHADYALRQEAQAIMDALNMRELGGTKTHKAVFHLGGGTFGILLPGAIEKSPQHWRVVDDQVIEKLKSRIKSNIDKTINKKTIESFFPSRLSVSHKKLKALGLDSRKPRMQEIPHPKRPFEKGIEVGFYTHTLTTAQRGGKLVDDAVKALEGLIATDRNQRAEIYEQSHPEWNKPKEATLEDSRKPPMEKEDETWQAYVRPLDFSDKSKAITFTDMLLNQRSSNASVVER